MARAKGERPRRDTWDARPPRVGPLERSSASERAADELRRCVTRGDVRPGQRMKSMRDLADEIGVSLGVVREAVARLKGEGLLEVRHGVGVFAARRQPGPARAIRAARLRTSRREAAELRAAVEPAAARAAAGRASLRLLEDLHVAMTERERAGRGLSPRQFTEADAAFHLMVAKATGNPLGIGLYRIASALAGRHVAARAAALVQDRELDELHRSLFEAIADGDRRRAEGAARAIAQIESPPGHEARPP